MKKLGQFFFIFIPVILAFLLQSAAVFFTMGISVMTELIGHPKSMDSAAALYDTLSKLISGTEFNSAAMLIYSLLITASFGLWYYIKYNGVYLVSPKKVFHPLSLIGILLLVPGGQFVTSYIVSFTSLLFPKWLESYEKLLDNAGLSGSISVFMLLYGVLIGPVAEELIFRGITLRQAQKCLPFWAANILQALVFGIYHMNMLQGVYAFFVGLLLGYVCHRGKIHSSMLLHILFNAWGLLLSNLFQFEMTNQIAVVLLLSTVILFAGGIITFHLGTNRLIKRSAEYE